ncbi:MAG: tRNA (adenosine(37)-N6)-dimethylallyltransferase MiaA [bacterium]|nr:tRNA (adenosine(37)-N6)-dimethylallyltransferase MiaA [bacterium]
MTSGRLICIVGPTCTGKTGAALASADEIGGPDAVEIVSCDSAKVYRGFKVGAAKLPPDKRRGYTFNMIDIADPAQPYTAGLYGEDAAGVIENIWNRHKLPVLVGGTGLYFRALVDGICDAPPADPEIRNELEERAAAGDDLLAELRQIDPKVAAKLNPNNRKRIVRALEVYRITGVPLGEIQEDTVPPLCFDELTVIGLDGPRNWLAERIERRTVRMVENGLEDEVRGLLDSGVPRDVPAMQAIGYKQTVMYLDGEIGGDEWFRLLARDTRRLAKRQRTWFKADERVIWLDASGDNLIVDLADLV